MANEYQHDRVKMFFKNLRNLVILTNVALELEGLKYIFQYSVTFIAYISHLHSDRWIRTSSTADS